MDKRKQNRQQRGIQTNPGYRMDIKVTNRTRPNIIGTLVEIVAGTAVLVVIVVVLLTGIGAVMVNMKMSGGLPQPVVDWSLGFYHYFFG